MTKDTIKYLQQGLKGLGKDPGPIDGIRGRKTEDALFSLADEWKGGTPILTDAATDLPWMAEAKRLLGRHEVKDSSWLRNWLKSDGKTLGDPAKLPWCGDFIETCIRLALPSEKFLSALGENPYWARNWLGLGSEIKPCYGAIAVFSRPGGGGHVAFFMGEDADAYHVIGGNQSNAVTVTRIAKSRLLGSRWPATFARPATPRLPAYLANGQLSLNEA